MITLHKQEEQTFCFSVYTCKQLKAQITPIWATLSSWAHCQHTFLFSCFSPSQILRDLPFQKIIVLTDTHFKEILRLVEITYPAISNNLVTNLTQEIKWQLQCLESDTGNSQISYYEQGYCILFVQDSNTFPVFRIFRLIKSHACLYKLHWKVYTLPST